MHIEQKNFCESVKARFPEYFENVDVLDAGSMDINGNNRYLFKKSFYTGLDIGEGKNVQVVTPIHLFNPEKQYDVIISTEMLEHDKFMVDSLLKMFNLLKPGGLMLITAATTGRKEHGTHKHAPNSSPHTNDFYYNVTPIVFMSGLDFTEFSLYEISVDVRTLADIRFLGIKK